MSKKVESPSGLYDQAGNELMVRDVGGIQMYHLPKDEHRNAIKEVIELRSYAKPSIGFDVEAKERWLDLGAHIGSFAVYCRMRGAVTHSYEPHGPTHHILEYNLGSGTTTSCVATNALVTGFRVESLRLWVPPSNDDRRHSIIQTARSRRYPPVPNVWIGDVGGEWDGVKMDVEGAEFGILDGGVLPETRKLVLEYHTTRDPSVDRLKRRVDFLMREFDFVKLPHEFERLLEGSKEKPMFDRLIYCWDKD